MSFQEEKNKNSVFLQNFQKRLSQFFQKTQGFTSNSSSNPTSTPSNLFDLQNNYSSADFNSTSIDSQNLSKVKDSALNSSRNYNSSLTKKASISNAQNETKSSRNARFSPEEQRFGKQEGNRKSRFSDNTKQQVVSITYEEIGLFPRSFNRVFDRFFKQLFFDVENLVIQEYRFYRYLFLTTVKCVFILLFVPLTINFFAKNYFVRPITEHYWNSHQPEIFLNSYQQKRAFNELQDFEEKIYFESLILKNPIKNPSISQNMLQAIDYVDDKKTPLLTSTKAEAIPSSFDQAASIAVHSTPTVALAIQHAYAPEFFSDSVQNRLHEKIVELAMHYNEESIEAITNFFADFISFSSLCYLFFALEIQINITKSFLLEVFFGLDDSKKSLFILFLTDLLVGYHSPNIWELFFSSFFDHYGLPENQTTIFLLVATLPVLLDVLFKYLIFRHLNRASPATVATYHAMIE